MRSARFGQIEFATLGQGREILVIHGAGGGFDQVLSAAGRLAAEGYRVIAPSRFGYLRSTNPRNPSPEQQADAFAELLDELHVERAHVLGISAGAPSALHFAARYPNRCRSLIALVPAASVAGTAVKPEGALPVQGRLGKATIRSIAKSDFLFWLAITLAPRAMIRYVLATDPPLVAAATPEERQRAYEMLWNILPIGLRADGLLNDARFVSTPQMIALDRITAPTLVVSLEDDYYRTAEPARFISKRIPGARLLIYPTGGHIWVGHHVELFGEIERFLREH